MPLNMPQKIALSMFAGVFLFIAIAPTPDDTTNHATTPTSTPTAIKLDCDAQYMADLREINRAASSERNFMRSIANSNLENCEARKEAKAIRPNAGTIRNSWQRTHTPY